MKDFKVYREGSIFLLQPQTDAARIWCDEHLPEDPMKWGDSYVVEHRYIGPIVEGLVADGYTVS